MDQPALFEVETSYKVVSPDEPHYHCRKCNEYLPENMFSPYAVKILSKDWDNMKGQGGGCAVWCKACKKEYHKGKHLAKSKAPPKPKEAIPCYNCDRMTEPNKLMLDHCHETHVFRGWLCRDCNTGIGKLGDTAQGIAKALVYTFKAEYDCDISELLEEIFQQYE